MDTTNTTAIPMAQASSSTMERNGPTLTDQQQKVHNQLLNWLDDKAAKPIVFKGYAGVGKSTTLGVFVESVKNLRSQCTIAMTAPTHKAVKVLRKFAIKDVDYRTLHSILALTEQVNEHTGEVFYAPDKYAKDAPPIEDIDLLIVDEVSMITDQLFNFLVPWIKKGLKVVFTGDPAQIPPVKHKDCIPFLHAEAWGMMIVELTEIIRQKQGNPILEFATAIRQDQKTGEFTPSTHLVNNTGVEVIKHASAEEKKVLEAYFTHPSFIADSDFMKVIAWRNVTVDNYNDIIRNILFKDKGHINDIMLHEKLLMNKPYVISARNILSRNDEIEVISVSTLNRNISWTDAYSGTFQMSFKFYNAGIEWYTDKGSKTGNIDIIHEESENDFKNIIDALKQIALSAPVNIKGKMWKQYYNFIAKSAWIKYNYAVTAHTSQGSTYDNTMVLKWDIDTNRNIEERNRILYVACTRARNRLYIEA